jgi:hypothetical protein
MDSESTTFLEPLGDDEPPDVVERVASRVENGDAVLLHYVGYAYHPRGVPSRLVAAIEAARRRWVGVRFGVMFHEVAAFGPPWRSSFWTRPAQLRLARRLLAASDGAATSLERYRDLLVGRRGAGGSEVGVLPIPSTVGEPVALPEWPSRPRRLVVFGSAGVRRRAWERERRALEAAVRAAGVEEVVDVGAAAGAPAACGGVPVRVLGVVEAARVSDELAAARFGFLAYPPDYLDKSTIYGAYLAHGLVPVCAWSGPRGRGPAPAEAWLRATAGGIEPRAEHLAAANRAREAYSARSVSRHAALWRALLFDR